jgi:hypothetical protein
MDWCKYGTLIMASWFLAHLVIGSSFHFIAGAEEELDGGGRVGSKCGTAADVEGSASESRPWIVTVLPLAKIRVPVMEGRGG